MLLALLIAILATVIALLRGGSLDNLARTRFRWTWIVFVGLVVQVFFELFVPDDFPGSARLAITLLSIGTILVFLLANKRLPGTLIASTGLGLNVLVIVVNGAMPVSLHAAKVAGISFGSFDQLGIKHEIMNGATRLRWLGDVIAIPHSQKIFSFGDVVLAAGLAILAYRCTLGADRSEEASPSSTSD
jgi:hypothetical protein